MSNKWHFFHSQYSPVRPGKVNTGANNLAADWERLASKAPGQTATVNGVDLAGFNSQYNNFHTKQDVKNFFHDVILKDVKKQSERDQMVNSLMNTFHQGGLLFPVSAPMSDLLKDSGLQPRGGNNINREIAITTTKHGFKIQEIFTVKELMVLDEIPDDSPEIKQKKKDIAARVEHDEDTMQIFPDAGNSFVMEVSAALDVDFSKNSSSPRITVESNYISYGKEDIKTLLDNRTLGQIIVDFFRNIFNLNAAEQATPVVTEVSMREIEDNSVRLN